MTQELKDDAAQIHGNTRRLVAAAVELESAMGLMRTGDIGLCCPPNSVRQVDPVATPFLDPSGAGPGTTHGMTIRSK